MQLSKSKQIESADREIKATVQKMLLQFLRLITSKESFDDHC